MRPIHISNVVPRVALHMATGQLAAEFTRRADDCHALAMALSETGDGQAVGEAVVQRYWSDAWRGMAAVVAKCRTPEQALNVLRALDGVAVPEMVAPRRFLAVIAALTKTELERALGLRAA